MTVVFGAVGVVTVVELVTEEDVVPPEVVEPKVAAAAISLLATGVPRPVTRSYPALADPAKLAPVVTSWKSAA